MASTEINDAVLQQTLLDAGLEDTDDNRHQLGVMLEALAIYQEREQVRNALWKKAGAEDCAHNLRHKSLRVAHADEPDAMEAAIDDALDAVNYALFFIRNVRAGRTQPT